ncbi:MAG TPA: hypothetical protein DEF07_04410 [Nitrosomonas sp.]|nr:hypothetical protein [Nitrosomonas sp.]
MKQPFMIERMKIIEEPACIYINKIRCSVKQNGDQKQVQLDYPYTIFDYSSMAKPACHDFQNCISFYSRIVAN